MPEELCRSVTQRVTGVILEMMIKIMPGCQDPKMVVSLKRIKHNPQMLETKWL